MEIQTDKQTRAQARAVRDSTSQPADNRASDSIPLDQYQSINMVNSVASREQNSEASGASNARRNSEMQPGSSGSSQSGRNVQGSEEIARDGVG